MRYFVVADDGNKYGPADLDTLNTWVNEGRVLKTTLLEEETSGARMVAGSVAGLIWSLPVESSSDSPVSIPMEASPYSSPPSEQQQAPKMGIGEGSTRNRPSDSAPEGNTEMIFSWILGGLGLIICCFGGWLLSAIGTLLGFLAYKKGHAHGQAALIFNVIVLTLCILTTIFFVVAGEKLGPKMKQMDGTRLQSDPGFRPSPPSFSTSG